MSLSIIRTLIESRIAAWAAAHSPALPVVYANQVDVSPVVNHLRVYVFPGNTTSEDLQGKHRSYVGSVQISVFAKSGLGPAEADTIAAELDLLYPDALRLTTGTFVLAITSPVSASVGVPEPGWYQVICRFRYQSENFIA